jgi:flavodoxin
MKSIVIYVSYHHNNTEKIAKSIAETLGAEMRKVQEIQPENLSEFNLIGFGSGIYYGKNDKTLLEFADKLPQVNEKKTFVFSTSGAKGKTSKFHEKLKNTLTSKGYVISGEFNCPGFDTFGALRLVGGISKGRPNEEDLKNAQDFALSLKEKT